MDNNKIINNKDIEKINLIDINLFKTYLLEINRNCVDNIFKKKKIILFIHSTLHKNYCTSLYYKIYHDIDLNKNIVLLIKSFNDNDNFPYINFTRLTYENFFSHISKKLNSNSLLTCYSQIFIYCVRLILN